MAELRQAGAIVVGMTTMPEFGWQGISWSPLYGMTHNPWNLDRTTAGSSAGSGAAVAAGLVPLAVGSDGAGSIRMPASFCGIVGLKPTYGRVAMYPVSVSELVTHYGPMARTVRDTAALLQAMAGPDPATRTACRPATRTTWPPARAVSPACGSRSARTSGTPRSTLRWRDRGAVREALRGARGDGGRGVAGFADPIWAADQYLWAARPIGRIPRLDEMRDQMDPGFVQAVEMMAERSLFDSAKARLVRLELAATMGQFFGQYDLLVTPTMADTAFGLDRTERPYGPTLAWSPFTYPFNLTGEPAISVPCGWTGPGCRSGCRSSGRASPRDGCCGPLPPSRPPSRGQTVVRRRRRPVRCPGPSRSG